MNKKIIIGIYKITSHKGRIYIGQSINITNRWYDYTSLCCKNQKKIYRSLKKHGAKNHTFEIIHILELGNLTKSEIIKELNKLETHYIKEYNSFAGDNKKFGLNLTRGGDNRECSEETKKKISKANKGKISPLRGIPMSEERKLKMCGENHPMFGKKQSEEHKNKAKETKKRNKEEKIANGTYVKPVVSEETRRKRSESQIGKEVSAETRAKQSKSQTGKKRSEEHNRKQSESMMGKNTGKHSEETIKKQSESHMGQKAWNKGIPMRKESKEKLRISKTGIKQSSETVSKRVETQKRNRQERLTMIF
jgi:group I intron endonuclease